MRIRLMGGKREKKLSPTEQLYDVKNQLETSQEKLTQLRVEHEQMIVERNNLSNSLTLATQTVEDQARNLLHNRDDFETIQRTIFGRDVLPDDPGPVKAVMDLKASYDTRVDERDAARARSWVIMALAILFTLIVCAATSKGQEKASYAWNDPHLSLHVPQKVLQMFRNPDGSCVQCSIGMCGTDQNVPEAAYLLWDSEYGPKVRGGSGPGRVERYAKERGFAVYNIVGDKTWDYMKWACRNGRGCAIGAGANHFQTLVGHDPEKSEWFVVNNNGDQRIQVYDDAAFRRLHLSSGKWCVVLAAGPAPAPPTYIAWWNGERYPNPPPLTPTPQLAGF